MSMKLSPVGSRTKSSKGFKVKHVLQSFVLFVVSIWLIYQLKHSYNKKAAAAAALNQGGLPTEETEAGEEILFRLGRKDLIRPIVGTTTETINSGKGEADEEIDEVKGDEIDEVGTRGGGDDEVDGRDQERTEEEEPEEVEDLIDVDDRERDESKGNTNESDGGEDRATISLLGDDDDDDEVKEMRTSRV